MEMNYFIRLLTERVLSSGIGITPEEAFKLTKVSEREYWSLLYAADTIRQAYKANLIKLCSIVNAKSGRCSMDCAFCAQSVHWKSPIEVYPFLSEEAILTKASATNGRATTFSIVTAGAHLTDTEFTSVLSMVPRLQSETDMQICVSIGMCTAEQLQLLYDSGIRHFHHNLETARSYSTSIRTTRHYDEDIAMIQAAQKHHLTPCVGGIFGMGESWEQRIELAVTIRDLGIDSIPLNFLDARPNTPLEHYPPLAALEALHIIAVYRFMFPSADIRIAGGRIKTLGHLQPFIFLAGANGMLIGDYLTTHGRSIEDDMHMLEQLELEPYSIEKEYTIFHDERR